LVIVRDRPVEVALGAPGAAAVGEGLTIFRSEFDRLIIVRNGAIEVAPAVPIVAAVVVADGYVGSIRIDSSKSAMEWPRSPSSWYAPPRRA
jgi:hypothetical protein